MNRFTLKAMAAAAIFAVTLSGSAFAAPLVPGAKTQLGSNYGSFAWLKAPNGNGVYENALPRFYGADQLPEFDGRGQVIGVVGAYHDAVPDLQADFARSIKALGLPPINGLPGTAACTVARGPHPCFEVRFVQPDGRTPILGVGLTQAYAEDATDVQASHAMAPGADIRLYLAASANVFDLFKAMRQAVSDQAVSVVTTSFTVEESYLLSDSAQYGSAFLKEQELAFSAGHALLVSATGNRGDRLMYPATSPQVLAVGGTTFRNVLRFVPREFEGAAGAAAGYSQWFERPAYQNGFNQAARRSAPDVALSADGFNTALDGMWATFGGTSVSAPLMAGAIARINQARSARNLAPIHSPAEFYSAARRSDQYGLNYKDITAGSATCSGGNCTATPGYDAATGLGAPRLENLIPAMAHMALIGIQDVKVSDVTSSSAAVTFETAVPTTGTVCLGATPQGRTNVLKTPGPFRACQKESGAPTRLHRINLGSLTRDTLYDFVAQARSSEYLAQADGVLFKTLSLSVSDATRQGQIPTLTKGTAVSGVARPGDQSIYYKFQGKAGDRISYELKTDRGWFILDLFEPGLTTRPRESVPTFSASSGRFYFPLPVDGTYILRLRTDSKVPINFTLTIR